MKDFLRSIIEMVLEGEIANTPKEHCSITDLTTTNPAWTGPRVNPNVRHEGPASNRLNHGTANLTKIASLPHALNLLLQSPDAV